MGLDFNGIIISDRFSAYKKYLKDAAKTGNKILWQVCLAHLIRDAKSLTENSESKVSKFGYWLRRELKLLIHLNKSKKKTLLLNACKARIMLACQQNKKNKNKPAKNLAKFICNNWESVVLFTTIEYVPPTNNAAERSFRNQVISRKISFGSDSKKGAKITAKMNSVVETLKQQGRNILQYFTEVITSHRKNQKIPLLIGDG